MAVGWKPVVVILAVVLAACASEPSSQPAAESADPSASVSSSVSPSASPPVGSPQEPYRGYPDSLVVIGHSGATGESTTPYEGQDTKSNSWASGTNPDVRSVYLRILEKNPAIEGHVDNLAVGGATTADMVYQAQEAVQLQPDLVLIQTIDNDLNCPATPGDVASFGDDLASLLDVLESEAPAARVFVLSQLGRPRYYAKSLTRAQRRMFGGTGPCAFLGPDGRIVQRELDRLESIIASYEKEVQKTCSEYADCTYDGGAWSKVVDRPGNFASDLNHYSIQGHAVAAAAAWRALVDEGLIPAR